MCGITAIFTPQQLLKAEYLLEATAQITHRGPDDEGYLLWTPGAPSESFAGKDTPRLSVLDHQLLELPLPRQHWKVGLSHRRLSILDLSSAGHQPMIVQDQLAITYNGEVYNYIEIRSELESLGYRFHSTTDTEVILLAWKEWGLNALHKFNGMFAFVLLDMQNQKLYAVRDRFGVKPLYYTKSNSYTAFASEAKQLRCLPDYTFSLNHQIAYDYLRYGLVDHHENTFEEQIMQLLPGCCMEIDVQTNKHTISRWYTLNTPVWTGTDQEACDQFRRLLKDSVRLRTRSDVPLGSALSGGLDSSTIVCLIKEVLDQQGDTTENSIQTVTSCHEDKKYDEMEYAEEVIRAVNATSYQVYPSFETLKKDFDRFLWHMDFPFASTSQYSQWCVFEGANQKGLKVMLDGQGADEQLAGYGGNDMSLYAGLIRKGFFGELYQEIKAYKSYKGKWPFAFLVGAAQVLLPSFLIKMIPDRFLVVKNNPPVWLRKREEQKTMKWPKSLNSSLRNQVQESPLPSLLRYEDRSSMAFSIESRVPFMDYRLVEFTLGLPEHLVYRRGERKYILREAFKGFIPEKIRQRKDKMGFVSAEERWLKEEGRAWFKESITEAVQLDRTFFKAEIVQDYLLQIQKGKQAFDHDPWRIICFSKWILSMHKTDVVKSN